MSEINSLALKEQGFSDASSPIFYQPIQDVNIRPIAQLNSNQAKRPSGKIDYSSLHSKEFIFKKPANTVQRPEDFSGKLFHIRESQNSNQNVSEKLTVLSKIKNQHLTQIERQLRDQSPISQQEKSVAKIKQGQSKNNNNKQRPLSAYQRHEVKRINAAQPTLYKSNIHIRDQHDPNLRQDIKQFQGFTMIKGSKINHQQMNCLESFIDHTSGALNPSKSNKNLIVTPEEVKTLNLQSFLSSKQKLLHQGRDINCEESGLISKTPQGNPIKDHLSLYQHKFTHQTATPLVQEELRSSSGLVLKPDHSSRGLVATNIQQHSPSNFPIENQDTSKSQKQINLLLSNLAKRSFTNGTQNYPVQFKDHSYPPFNPIQELNSIPVSPLAREVAIKPTLFRMTGLSKDRSITPSSRQVKKGRTYNIQKEDSNVNLKMQPRWHSPGKIDRSVQNQSHEVKVMVEPVRGVSEQEEQQTLKIIAGHENPSRQIIGLHFDRSQKKSSDSLLADQQEPTARLAHLNEETDRSIKGLFNITSERLGIFQDFYVVPGAIIIECPLIPSDTKCMTKLPPQSKRQGLRNQRTAMTTGASSRKQRANNIPLVVLQSYQTQQTQRPQTSIPNRQITSRLKQQEAHSQTGRAVLPNPGSFMKIVYSDQRKCNLDKIIQAKIPEFKASKVSIKGRIIELGEKATPIAGEQGKPQIKSGKQCLQEYHEYVCLLKNKQKAEHSNSPKQSPQQNLQKTSDFTKTQQSLSKTYTKLSSEFLRSSNGGVNGPNNTRASYQIRRSGGPGNDPLIPLYKQQSTQQDRCEVNTTEILMSNTYHNNPMMDLDTVAGGFGETAWRLEGRLHKLDDVVILQESQNNFERLTSSNDSQCLEEPGAEMIQNDQHHPQMSRPKMFEEKRRRESLKIDKLLLRNMRVKQEEDQESGIAIQTEQSTTEHQGEQLGSLNTLRETKVNIKDFSTLQPELILYAKQHMYKIRAQDVINLNKRTIQAASKPTNIQIKFNQTQKTVGNKPRIQSAHPLTSDRKSLRKKPLTSQEKQGYQRKQYYKMVNYDLAMNVKRANSPIQHMRTLSPQVDREQNVNKKHPKILRAVKIPQTIQLANQTPSLNHSFVQQQQKLSTTKLQAQQPQQSDTQPKVNLNPNI